MMAIGGSARRLHDLEQPSRHQGDAVRLGKCFAGVKWKAVGLSATC
jgi:hypothetical protein